MANRKKSTRKRNRSARGGRSATRPPHPRTRPAAVGPGARRRAARDPAPRLRPVSPRALGEGLMHSCAPDQPCWKLVPLVLALAFAARAAVALTGDFVLHPDEIMQYLEPAHRLAFGNGVIYWEYFYGARSWLVPGAVAAVLKLFDIVGLGEPFWYVGGVKLFFCALSLAIPAAMYCFARRHFGETAARVALIAGAFWYELAGFAHKPLTEFVATAPLVGLLALCVRPTTDRPREVWLAAGLAVLAGAIRMQYAPVALVLLAIVFLRTRLKLLLLSAAAALFCAVGIFDALTWDGGLFHSYVTNLRFNLMVGGQLSGAGSGISAPLVAHARRRRVERAVPRGGVTVTAALRFAPRTDCPGVVDPFRAGAQGIPLHFRRYSAVAADRRRPRGARRGVGRGTAAGQTRRRALDDGSCRRAVCGRVLCRHAESAARSGAGVSSLVD